MNMNYEAPDCVIFCIPSFTAILVHQNTLHSVFKNLNSVKKEYQQDATIYMIYCQFQMLIIDYSLDMFQASLCPSSGEKTTCYCIWGIFAGSVGCGRLQFCGATL